MIEYRRDALIDWVITRRDCFGDKFIFTNGCFDLLTSGHAKFITRVFNRFVLPDATASTSILVALNSDHSVRTRKGHTRPFNKLEDRAEVMEAMRGVSIVTSFNSEEDLLELIKAIRPEFLVKGGDYDENKIAGSSFVKSYGGVVYCGCYDPTVSTTILAERIQKAPPSLGAVMVEPDLFKKNSMEQGFFSTAK